MPVYFTVFYTLITAKNEKDLSVKQKLLRKSLVKLFIRPLNVMVLQKLKRVIKLKLAEIPNNQR